MSLESAFHSGARLIWFVAQVACASLRSAARAALLTAVLINLCGETIVVPGAYSRSPGEGAQLLPTAGEGEGRYQNVFASSELASVMPNGGLIRQVSFRLDETVMRDLSGKIPEFELRMGTSPSLTPIITLEFSRNIGSDYHVVVPRRSLDYTVLGSDGVAMLAPFSLVIPLERPYLYDPRKGAFLVDLFMRGATTTLRVDVGGSFGLFGGVEGKEGSYVPPLIMSLDFIPVPEPSAAIIGSVGMLLFMTLKTKLRA